MFTPRHCTFLVLLAGVGCATAAAGDDIGYEVPGEQPSDAAPGAGGDAMAAGTGTGPTTAAGGTTGGGVGVPAVGGRASATAGRSGRVGGGATSAGGRASLTGGAGMPSSVACASPRMPAMAGATQGNSGSFDTTDSVCYFVTGTFNNWACSNIGGRTVTVNGMPAMCGGPLPAQADGGYYFEFSASTNATNYTSFYWYTS
jgi:hypothetical protein